MVEISGNGDPTMAVMSKAMAVMQGLAARSGTHGRPSRGLRSSWSWKAGEGFLLGAGLKRAGRRPRRPPLQIDGQGKGEGESW